MNFKSLRDDKLKLSQEQMADMIGVSVDVIRQWDIDNQVTLNAVQKIAINTGMDFNEIMGYEKPMLKIFEAKDTWEKTESTRKGLINYLESALDKYDLTDAFKKKYIDDLTERVRDTLVKPSISIVGRSDTGKSTLINSLLGAERMPTSWTPTTSIAVYIKHIDDRPEFIEDDAWVFADHYGNEQFWDIKKLQDQVYCNQWVIAKGEISILRDFGTRQGDNYSKQAGAAVVFVDAPILKNCDIVDLPGFGTETESDDLITMKVAQKTDILIYLSQANGFMRIEDITYLKENVRNLPVWEEKEGNDLKPLSNLFVVASQAHTVNNGNREQLTYILRVGCENFSKALGDGYWNNRAEMSGYKVDYSAAVLPRRFFTYTTDIPELCKQFDSELKHITEKLPSIIEDRTKTIVRKYVESRKPSLQAEISHYEEISRERKKYESLLEEIDAYELSRIQETESSKKKIIDDINMYSTESRDEFSKFCSEQINTDTIASLLKSQGVKNKKEEIELFASRLQDRLTEKCESILKRKSEKLSEETKEFISKFNDDIGMAFEKSNVNVDFDAGFAFVSALSTIGIVGGLGAYLASEAAFWFGSTAFIAGLGGDLALGGLAFGPIGIAVGLVIAGVIGLVKLFGGGWEKSVAKKIVSSYEENNVMGKYRENIEEYWKNTEKAFNTSAEKLEQDWNTYVETLRNTVNNYDVDEINYNMTTLKNIEVFFENIPL